MTHSHFEAPPLQSFLAAKEITKMMSSIEKRRNVAIFLFDDIEVLDFAGPFEVFSVTGQQEGKGNFNVYTVAQKSHAILARNGLSINPRYSFADCPKPDILVIPGGYGTRPVMKNAAVIEWIVSQAKDCELVLSVCSGALLLAKAGLLENQKATTHHSAMEELKLAAPNTQVMETQRVVDNGRVVLSAGVTAGIDMAFHVVQRLLGESVAEETANYIEYRRMTGPDGVFIQPDSNC